jgi:photosystem II stability/assembly factor-like uncharacterized protein
VLLLSSFALPAAAQQMKLLAPGIGWVQQSNTLYWTNDDGAHWQDITPEAARPLQGRIAVVQSTPNTAGSPHPAQQAPRGVLTSVFFLNPAEGWAILDEGAPDSGDYLLAHTEDGGKHWSVEALAYPPLPDWQRSALAGPLPPFFVDRLHGWIQMGFSGNSRPGRLMMTEDGSKTWKWTNGPGETGEMFFLSRQRGWIACSGWDEKVFVTKDGAKSWQPVSVPQAAGTEGGQRRMLRTPVFRDDRHGILAVNYVFPWGTPSQVAIYKTTDAGDHWQIARILILALGKQATPFALVGSDLALVAATSRTAAPTVRMVPLVGDNTHEVQPSSTEVSGLSFFDATHWWVWKTGGQFATEGNTWHEITPGPKPIPSHGMVIRNGIVQH